MSKRLRSNKKRQQKVERSSNTYWYQKSIDSYDIDNYDDDIKYFKIKRQMDVIINALRSSIEMYIGQPLHENRELLLGATRYAVENTLWNASRLNLVHKYNIDKVELNENGEVDIKVSITPEASFKEITLVMETGV